jgi:hypothetical protein
MSTIKTTVIQPLTSGGILSIKQGDGITDVLQIDGSGKLGIRMPSGVGLASPMTINHDSTGTGMTGLASYGGIHLHQSSGNNGFVGITSKATSSTGTQGGFLIEGSSSFGTKLHLMTTESYTAGMKHRVVVDHYGKVGIGTLTPAVSLDVAGPDAGIWVRPSNGGGLVSSAGAGLKIEYVSTDSTAKLQAYDYATSTAKNISLNSSGGDVIIENNLKLGSSVLATTGYTKLPNGIMMQWGETSIAGVHGGLYTITYPIAFSQFWTNTFVVQNNALSTVTTVQYLHGKTTTTPLANFIVQSGSYANGTTYPCTVRWFAIGLA